MNAKELKYYRQLVNAKITGFKPNEDDEGSWPKFSVTLASGEKVYVEVSRDPEGNGPGFLFIG